MMHRCSQGHVMGTCTCGMFHNNQMQLFSMPNHYENDSYSYDQYDTYSSSSSSSSSVVDCTLSLGTPSTRFTEDEEKRTRNERRSSLTNFSWKSSSQSQSKSNGSGTNNDSLLARRCANCDTTSTPLWRNGPRGPKSLCNACGIRYKKEERRANAAAATSAVATGGVMESGIVYGHQNSSSSWYAEPQSQKYGNELCFMDDSNGHSENGIPFMSWRLNVADRTNLVHDFTRY